MLTANMPLIDRLRKQASVIHIAAEKECADDVSDALRKAADRIEKLEAAIKPFAECPPGSGDRLLVVDARSGPYHFLEADLQRAKSVLKSEEQ